MQLSVSALMCCFSMNSKVAFCVVLTFLLLRSQIRCEYPLNLSISVSGGKETKKDSLSNCE